MSAISNTNPTWGKTLSKKELLDMIDRIYKKQEKNKKSIAGSHKGIASDS